VACLAPLVTMSAAPGVVPGGQRAVAAESRGSGGPAGREQPGALVAGPAASGVDRLRSHLCRPEPRSRREQGRAQRLPLVTVHDSGRYRP